MRPQSQRALFVPVVVALLLGAAIAFPLGVIASHQFSDVLTSNTFHNDIDAIADAGVTTGCAAGKYCPKEFVTREQMAAFLNRLGALGPGKTPVVNADKLDGLTSGQFARTDQTHYYACAGSTLAPVISATEYFGSTSHRFLAAGSGALICPVHLPDGATVTSFSGEVYDSFVDGEIYCILQRHPSSIGGSYAEVAKTESSVDSLDGPDVHALLVDSTINDPVIDNRNPYTAGCFVSGASTNLRVFNVTLTYIGAP